ncbi:MAG: heme peroxidase family protein [Pseudomonadota bacterium]
MARARAILPHQVAYHTQRYDLVEGLDPAPDGLPGHRGSFRYLYSDVEDFPLIDEIDLKLVALAEAMVESEGQSESMDSSVPAIFTYFGQFIGHDVTAHTDRDFETSKIADTPLHRLPREVVESKVRNLRRGTLDLNSLYGDGPGQTENVRRLERALREGARMRLGVPLPVGSRPPLPRDNGADLPRIGALISDGAIDPDDLPEELRPVGPNAEQRKRLALIGDGRNDENLVVAQLHVAFLRFHNEIIRALSDGNGAEWDLEELFAAAKRQVQWTYQWLVINEFLPQVCDPAVLAFVLEREAPIYRVFLERGQECGSRGALPIPLEFSSAAYRFGHSMVRASYDFNRNFGRPADDLESGHRAKLDQLFTFTGRGDNPIGGFGFTAIPENWLIEWDRFVRPSPDLDGRTARKINSQLARELDQMVNEGLNQSEPREIFKRLALRNLRRGYNLNLPSAQALIARMAADGHTIERPLSADQLRNGRSGEALFEGGFLDQTPLWFYVLKEAEEQADGEHLGELGSRLVAETLVGLVVNDRSSYWNETNSCERWSPHDAVWPNDEPVTSLAKLLAAAGVLARETEP